jgi:hypothetical protein
MNLAVVLGVDVKARTTVGGESNRVFLVWVVLTVLLKGNTFEALIRKRASLFSS